MNNYVKALAFITITVAINLLITRNIIQNELFAYKAANPPAKFISVNMDSLVKSKIDAGESALDVLEYTQKMTTLLLNEGYLILDEAMLVAPHPDYKLKPLSISALDKALKEKGLSVDEDINEALEQGKEALQDILTMKQ